MIVHRIEVILDEDGKQYYTETGLEIAICQALQKEIGSITHRFNVRAIKIESTYVPGGSLAS